MKHFIYLALMIFLFSSCNLDEQADPTVSEIGIWEMSEIRSSWGLDPVNASDLDYTETYEFRVDGTFTNFNSRINKPLNGQYEIDNPGEEFSETVKSILILTYDQNEVQELLEEFENELQEGDPVIPFYWIVYSQNAIESLSLQTDGTLINAGFGIMDGPVFVYLK